MVSARLRGSLLISSAPERRAPGNSGLPIARSPSPRRTLPVRARHRAWPDVRRASRRLIGERNVVSVGGITAAPERRPYCSTPMEFNHPRHRRGLDEHCFLHHACARSAFSSCRQPPSARGSDRPTRCVGLCGAGVLSAAVRPGCGLPRHFRFPLDGFLAAKRWDRQSRMK
jgi:hypothetical protein